jgi:spermidine synthase
MHKSSSPLPAGLLPVLVLIFFFSGASGLVYQVLWLRMLGLVFGVTVYAASTVWASFMAGLALGSVVGGRLGDRTSRPLVWFGGVEIMVGVSALATPFALDALYTLYAAWYPSLPQSVAALTLARGLMAFAVLIVPTLLMGATLPLVIRSALFRSDELGSRVGLLYGTNTAGAIVGTLAAGLYLIPGVGIGWTFRIAALINVTAGLIALVAGLRAGPRTSASVALESAPTTDRAPEPAGRRAETASNPDPVGISPVGRWIVLGVFLVSGLATLALEVIWFRVIVLVARPTVYAFSMMLASVLLGIAIGSYLVTPFLRRSWSWLAILAGMEIAMAGAALMSLNTLGSVDQITRWIEPYVALAVPAYLAYPIAAAVPAILPTSVLMGMAFPVGLMLWAEGGGREAVRVASRVGVFYGVNLGGAIAGSIVAGFLLLPMLGSRTSLVGVSALILLSGVALILALPAARSLRVGIAGAVAVLFVLGARAIPDPFDTFLRVRYPTQPAIWREEAVQGTVSVHTFGPRFSLFLDGNHQASDTGSMVGIHRRIAHLALAVHPEARQVLVVGLGGGATAGAASIHDGVELDVVELSDAVVRASDFFRHVNYDLLRRPNVHLRVDDARNYLMLTRKKYDVITADIILPIHVGSNNVYSQEYFELVRGALKPGGMVMQWVWGTEAEYRTIARTFLSVFPNTTIWIDGSLLLGSVEPLELRKADFGWKRQLPGRKGAMDELGLETFERLLALYKAGPDELRQYLGLGPVLTDDRPLAEYFLSLPRDREPDLSGVTGDVRRHVVE